MASRPKEENVNVNDEQIEVAVMATVDEGIQTTAAYLT